MIKNNAIANCILKEEESERKAGVLGLWGRDGFFELVWSGGVFGGVVFPPKEGTDGIIPFFHPLAGFDGKTGLLGFTFAFT